MGAIMSPGLQPCMYRNTRRNVDLNKQSKSTFLVGAQRLVGSAVVWFDSDQGPFCVEFQYSSHDCVGPSVQNMYVRLPGDSGFPKQ